MHPLACLSRGFCQFAVYLVAVLALTAAPAARTALARPSAIEPVDSPALAAKIDQYLATRHESAKLQPARQADDAEFLRRIYLDLAGRIPSVSEARAFLEDTAPDKRAKLIDHLLSSQAYVNHFANFWRSLMLPDNGGNIQFRLQTPDFEAWLRKRLRDNVAYDAMVRELLTTGANGPANVRVGVNGPRAEASPAAFYQFNENKPENLAAATSRLFLGIKLECAQCHDHPFAQWKREQFWSYAAFFASLQPERPRGNNNNAGMRDNGQRREIKIPGTDRKVPARFLDGAQPDWPTGKSARVVLAEWVTAPENPYFARAAVNRLWGHLFGHGLIEPIDDLLSDQGGGHAELLDELASQFSAHQFDVKYLLKALALSDAYQRTSAAGEISAEEARLFGHMAVKGLTPEQLFDSLAVATGWQDGRDSNVRRPIAVLGGGGPRDEFLTKFANATDKRTEVQTSILQALSLMNGRFIDNATSINRSELLAAVADAPFLEIPQKIETLFLAALSRKPSAKEVERLTTYLKDGDADKALADVFWALLNSSEFVLNH